MSSSSGKARNSEHWAENLECVWFEAEMTRCLNVLNEALGSEADLLHQPFLEAATSLARDVAATTMTSHTTGFTHLMLTMLILLARAVVNRRGSGTARESHHAATLSHCGQQGPEATMATIIVFLNF